MDSQIKSYVLHIYDTAWVKVSGYPTIITQPGNFPSDSVKFTIGRNSGFFFQNVDFGFRTYQNYPNPFNSNTEISFNSPNILPAYLVVRNELGQQVYAQKLQAVQGTNTVDFSRNNLPQGMYFYSIQTGDNIITRRMVIKD